MFKAIANAYREAFSGLPREVWYLAIGMLVNRSGSMVMSFLSLYIQKELGYSEGVAATMIAVWGLGSAVGTYVGGFATERFGPLRVLIGALVGNAIGFVVLSRMPDYWSFAVTLFLVSMVSETFRPANLAALTLLCEPVLHRRAIALNRLAVNLGFSIGPTVGGFVAMWSYQWLFWLDAATCFAAGVVLYYLLYSHHADLKRRVALSDGEVRQNPLRDAKFIAFVLLSIVSFAIFFQLLSTYPLFLKGEYHLVEGQIGVLLSLNTVVVCLCEMVLVHRIGHWNQLRTIAWGSFLMCAGFGLLPFGRGFGFAAICVLVWTVGEMLAMPAAMLHAAAYADEQSRGRYIGLYTTGVSLSFVVGPLLAARAYQQDHFLGWYVSLVVGFIVLVGFYLLQAWESRACDSSASAPEDVPARIN
jgi:MFS family permease